MQKHRLENYVGFLNALKNLLWLEEGHLILPQGNDPGILGAIRQALAFVNNENQIYLSEEMKAGITNLRRFHAELRDRSATDRLAVEEQSDLAELVQELETTFLAQTREVFVFIAEQGAREAPDLLDLFAGGKLPDAMPKIAQANFEDALKCFRYEEPVAAVTLALQSVEGTLRYVYLRDGGPPKQSKRGWAKMLGWLRGKKKIGDDCFQNLDSLRREHRNYTAHGRVKYTAPDAVKILRRCADGLEELVRDHMHRQSLRVQLKVSAPVDFDLAVALYLYFANPELPPIKTEDVVITPPNGTRLIKDEWLERADPRGGEPCLANVVMKRLGLESEQLPKPLNRIVGVAREWIAVRDSKTDQWEFERGGLSAFYRGIQIQSKNKTEEPDEINANAHADWQTQERSVLINGRKLFDNFISLREVPEDNLRLAERLDYADAWRALESSVKAEHLTFISGASAR
jgi:hypothetical protein